MELESSPCARAGERDGIGDGSKFACVGERKRERRKRRTAALHRIGRAVEGSRG